MIACRHLLDQRLDRRGDLAARRGCGILLRADAGVDGRLTVLAFRQGLVDAAGNQTCWSACDSISTERGTEYRQIFVSLNFRSSPGQRALMISSSRPVTGTKDKGSE